MPRLQQNLLLDEHSVVSAFLEVLHRSTATTEVSAELDSASLELIKSSKAFAENKRIDILLAKIGPLLTGSSKETAEAALEKSAAAKDAIAELRLQLAISVFGLTKPKSAAGEGESNIETFLAENAEKEFAMPITWLRGEIATALIGTTRVLLFPSISSVYEAEDILVGLAAQYEKSSSNEDWLLDFSAIRFLPVSIVADLLAYGQQFNRGGRELLAAWLRKDVLTKTAESKLVESLNLVLVANHWFSRGPAKDD